MKTIVNIGTNKKNIVGVVFHKPFIEITYEEIREAAIKVLGTLKGNKIQGWCDVTKSKNKD